MPRRNRILKDTDDGQLNIKDLQRMTLRDNNFFFKFDSLKITKECGVRK